LTSVEASVAEVLPPYEVVLNVGRKQGVVKGALVTVWRTLDVADPSTQAVIGRVRRPKMRFRVSEVQDGLSIAESIEFYVPPLSGFFTTTRSAPRRERKKVAKGSSASTTGDVQTAAIQIGDEVTVVPPSEEETTSAAG
jgi:hypothetical protein